MALAIRQAATPAFLLSQWRADGWSIYRSAVISQVPVGTSSGKVLIPTQLDAFEWKDVTLFGVGNLDDAIAKLQGYIRAGGSELHSYALFRRVDVDLFGLRVVSYRLLLYHSVVQLVIGAVAIVAIAFAAVLFLQYISTGQSPIAAIKELWPAIVKPVQDGVQGAIGSATGGISEAWILAIVGAGAISLAFGMASRSTGVKIREPKGPSGSVGVRAGPASVRVSS